MIEQIRELFSDAKLVDRIKQKLPQLFHLAELESSRAGKIGMEVGTIRERIIAALLIFKFGEQNVKTDIPITEAETDILLYNKPISIKTITGKNFGGIKLIWTVDAQKAIEFSKNYKPSCDLILVQINWDNGGGFYYIPLEVQQQVLKRIGNKNYIKLPKAGTNPRGVEMEGEAMRFLVSNPKTLTIPIDWRKESVNFNAYNRWVELWSTD
ncbi:MAG: ThaI family type II restriction endonuclease [Chitinophagaceae bacterium]|nr:ThaI family type II restriction endonuclease [Chitinophagaceae bacterium]